MEYTILRSHERGLNQFSWLESYHSFSFGHYYEPDRIHFGALRVLNDDTVAKGMGFSRHPHHDMEIISIPLQGILEHKDSMGTVSTIQAGEIQVMSAGTGVEHSEFNRSKEEEVKFLQIWVIPKENGIKPSYQQMFIPKEKNLLHTIISPTKENNSLSIHQNAWFSIGDFDVDQKIYYSKHQKENGIFIFNLEGRFELLSELLDKRDSFESFTLDDLNIKARGEFNKLLIIEVPRI